MSSLFSLSWRILLFTALVSIADVAWTAEVEAPNAAGAETTANSPSDARLGQLRTLDDEFLFEPSRSLGQWEPIAQSLRERLLVASGLWPMPTKTPLAPKVFGRVERDDYSVDRVVLETLPGHFLTGSLYRPKNVTTPAPAVLCPHGHWENGRFQRTADEQVAMDLKSGAERFENAARHPLQARCVQLARMGFFVFHYDMEGYADNRQLTHRPKPEIRTELVNKDHWGYFSPQAEARMFSMFGLQTWNGIRALDWLATLPEVDPLRIGMTGASGGGTQTFVLAAIDPRIRCAFPAVMVSTAMQGGCTCENACYLRLQAGNVDYAALVAPRALGMTGADDWTREILTKGLPELKRHYGLFGAAERVHAEAFPQFQHNFNGVSGEVMYQWMAKHLQPERAHAWQERDFEPLTIPEMTVWSDQLPKPNGGEEHEVALLRGMDNDLRNQQKGLLANGGESFDQYKRVVGTGWRVLIGRDASHYPISMFTETNRHAGESVAWFQGRLDRPDWKESSRCNFLKPRNWNGDVVVWLDGKGRAAVANDQGEPTMLVQKALNAGAAIAGIDLMYQDWMSTTTGLDDNVAKVNGDLAIGRKEDGTLEAHRARAVGDPEGWNQQAASYTYGYNHPIFAQRTHDVIALCEFIAKHERMPKRIFLVGSSGAGSHALAAAAILHTRNADIPLAGVAVDLQSFNFENILDVRHPDFMPGAVRYGDVTGLAALCAPLPLLVQGQGLERPVIEAAYQSMGAGKQWIMQHSAESPLEEWISRQIESK